MELTSFDEPSHHPANTQPCEELGDPNGDGTPTGSATVTNPGRPLEILVQPESQTVGQGTEVTFSVGATTTFGPLYQGKGSVLDSG